MKSTNLEKAAKSGYYQLSNLPEHIKSDKWFSEKYLNSEMWEQNIPAIFEDSTFDVGVFAEVRSQKKNFSDEIELYFVDHFKVLLFADELDYPLMVQRENRTNKYYLYPINNVVNKLQRSTNYDQRKPYLDAIKEPCKIGVYSDKKVIAWINYCAEYINALQACNDAISGRKKEHESCIKSVIDSLPTANVQQHQNTTYITTKYFEIKFEIRDNGNYLHKQVHFIGKIEDIIKITDICTK